jgi:hypothetical protein
MDREQFDTLARLVWTRQSRRTALATVLGAALVGHAFDPAIAKRKNKNKRRRNHRDCYPGTPCIPGPGKDNAGCDFSGSVAFFERNVQGSNLSHTNLTGAQMAKADLSGVDLGGSCLVGANLLEANLGGANLDGAVFCGALMPDGSINDSGCGDGTRCCPTGCPGGVCATECLNHVGQTCSIFGALCCRSANLFCTPSLIPLLTTCQMPCNNDEHCIERLGPEWRCEISVNNCPFSGPCCVK